MVLGEHPADEGCWRCAEGKALDIEKPIATAAAITEKWAMRMEARIARAVPPAPPVWAICRCHHKTVSQFCQAVTVSEARTALCSWSEACSPGGAGDTPVMLKRFVKRSLQRCGIRLPFSDVICAEHLKSICIGPEGRAKVTVQEKLVFLDLPEIGDLHDTCAVDQETTFDNFICNSPDSAEGGRRRARIDRVRHRLDAEVGRDAVRNVRA